ncbi:hypothetical protein N7450_001508 [Penicillium hetheringtonii]|uniref:Uncharacterized protein n=1 Tax=Penicillium hetheringtonii TaxID=911720 RepID=A0AAD6E4A2_9EURO|nr:hypothetical protein N7450_001508 [Penicillium hetheringtonii]
MQDCQEKPRMSQERDVSGKCILKREKGETRPARNAKPCSESRSWHSATVSANHRRVAARSRANAETSRVRHQGLGGKQRGMRQAGSAGARTMVDGLDWLSKIEIPQIRDVDFGTALGGNGGTPFASPDKVTIRDRRCSDAWNDP